MRNAPSIAMLCENLLVSTSGFYDWDARRSAPGPRALEDLALADGPSPSTPSAARPMALPGSPSNSGTGVAAMDATASPGSCGRSTSLAARKAATASKPPTASSTNPSPPIASRLLPRPPPPTRSGSTTSPTYRPAKVGSISSASSISTAAGSSAGPCPTIDSALVLAALSMGPCIAPRRPDSSSTPTAASSTPPGQLLPQRLHGKLLEHPRTGAGLPREVHQPATRQVRDLRLHRSLLQPPAPPHLPRRPFTRPLRTQKQPT